MTFIQTYPEIRQTHKGIIHIIKTADIPALYKTVLYCSVIILSSYYFGCMRFCSSIWLFPVVQMAHCNSTHAPLLPEYSPVELRGPSYRHTQTKNDRKLSARAGSIPPRSLRVKTAPVSQAGSIRPSCELSVLPLAALGCDV